MENLSQFYQLRHLTEPCIVKYMAYSLQTQQDSRDLQTSIYQVRTPRVAYTIITVLPLLGQLVT